MKGLLVLAVAVLVLLTTPDVRACGCPWLPPDVSDEVFKAAVAKGYKNAIAVFAGEVIAEEYRPAEEGGAAGREVLVIRLAAESWWKGEQADKVILYTQTYRYPDGSGSSTSCDYNFAKGQKYLVYAFGGADKLSTHACVRTRLMKHAERDIKALDEIKQNESSQ